MKKYTALTNIIFLFTIATVIGMDPTSLSELRRTGNPITDDIKEQAQTDLNTIITFLGQRPTPLVQSSASCHSILKIDDANDEVTMRICPDTICTWNMSSGELTHTEQAPKHHIQSAIICGDKTAYRSISDPLVVNICDTNTGNCLRHFTEANHVMAIAMNNDIIVTGLFNGKIHIRNINNGKLEHAIDTKSVINTLILQGDNQIITGSPTLVQIWDLYTGDLLKTFNSNQKDPLDEIRTIAANNTMITAKMNNSLYVWNINTGSLLTTITKFTYDLYGTKLALGNNYVVTASIKSGVEAKTWRLLPNLNGTPKSNPLLWIMQKANTQQQDLIKRAYEATLANQELIITLPEDPGIVSLSESQEIKDGRLYPTLTLAVRNYLRTRLNITVY